jgi:hypothetical protein
MNKGKRKDFGDSLLCTSCNEVKLKTEFHKNPTKRIPYNAWCKECYKKYKEQVKEEYKYLEENNYSKEGQKRARLKYVYGLTSEDWNKMYSEQQGCCAICNTPETLLNKGLNKRLGVDHCHRTGDIRGLLCDNCNLAIGMLGDDIELLKSAILYLQKYQKINIL